MPGLEEMLLPRKAVPSLVSTVDSARDTPLSATPVVDGGDQAGKAVCIFLQHDIQLVPGPSSLRSRCSRRMASQSLFMGIYLLVLKGDQSAAVRRKDHGDMDLS